jgi:hypothetical protein
MKNTSNLVIDDLVEHLFQSAPDKHEILRRNPVDGGHWVAGLDPIRPQKRRAKKALIAQALFDQIKPPDAPRLPLSGLERKEMNYTDPMSHLVSCFALSWKGQDYDLDKHPSFSEFVSGVLASRYAPDVVKNDEGLRRRFPPRPLKGLGPGLCWQPDHEMSSRLRKNECRRRDGQK